jgi:hypothetical protein
VISWSARCEGRNVVEAELGEIQPIDEDIDRPHRIILAHIVIQHRGKQRADGTVAAGNTRRPLSFFVMVLAFSRQMFVEFIVSQTIEHFLACPRAERMRSRRKSLGHVCTRRKKTYERRTGRPVLT